MRRTDPLWRGYLVSAHDIEPMFVVSIGLPFSRVNVGIIVAKYGVVIGFADACMKRVSSNLDEILNVKLKNNPDLKVDTSKARQAPVDQIAVWIGTLHRHGILFDEVIELAQDGVMDYLVAVETDSCVSFAS